MEYARAHRYHGNSFCSLDTYLYFQGWEALALLTKEQTQEYYAIIGSGQSTSFYITENAS